MARHQAKEYLDSMALIIQNMILLCCMVLEELITILFDFTYAVMFIRR